MAANVPPPGAPRPGSSNLIPPPNYNPNAQRTSESLADNFQNLNLNRPPSMLNSGPRPAPFGQPPPFPSAAPSHGIPGAPTPFSRPGPPPAALARPSVPPSGLPPAALPSAGAPVRPTGVPVAQPSPFVSRPPPGSFPSSMGSYVAPGSGPFPSGIPQSSSLVSGPVAPPSLPPVAQPIPLSSPLAAGQILPPSRASSGLMTNGPPTFATGALPGGPRFPPTGSAQQPPLGPPQTMAALAPRAPTMGTDFGGLAVSSPPGPPVQPRSPFSIAAQGMLPAAGSPFGSPSWPMQPGQV